MMNEGNRVIALATVDEVICLIGMQDLVRKDVIQTIMSANTAGVRTIMITGDHKKTAAFVAEKLNIIKSINEVMSKEELDKLSDIELDKVIEKYNVYARVEPIDKVRIVEAWQRKGMVVAMTGDGINDAPALKVADIGCAMGSGAEISKDCADIILVDSNYNTIIKAIKNGRGIYENIKRCCKYLLSSNIGEVLTILIITLTSLITKIDLGIPLLAIHLLWINIITDSLPAFGLGVMNPSNDLMKKAPRKKEESFFDKKLTIDIFFMGIVIGLLTVISYIIGLRIDSIYATTMAFITISTAQLLHSYNCSSDYTIFNKNTFKNKFLNLSFVIGMFLQIMVVYIDKVNVLFKLKPLPLNLLFIAIGISILIVVIAEVKKKIEKKK
jgi:Ca2+-transporting ATPase